MKRLWQTGTRDRKPTGSNDGLTIAGDSHCLAFDGIEIVEGTSKTRFRSAFCSSAQGLGVTNLAEGDTLHGTTINADLRIALDKVGLSPISQDSTDDSQIHEGIRYFLVIGGVDAIVEATHPDWQTYDIMLPSMVTLFDENRLCFPFGLYAQRLRHGMRNFSAGLLALRRQYGPFGVLTPPPPHADNRQLIDHYESRGVDALFAASDTRWKLARFVLDEIERCCADLGLPFVDTWPHTASDRFLDPAFEMDGFHGNRAYAERVGRLLVGLLRARAT